MPKCDAINLSNNKPCKRTDTRKYIMPGNYSTQTLCTKHIEQMEKGKTLRFHTDPEQPYPTVAVITDDDLTTTHFDLKTGVETVQPSMLSKEDTVTYFIISDEEAVMIDSFLDYDKVQRRANTLYSTNYRMGQTSMRLSMAPDGNGQTGYIYCGSVYVGKVMVTHKQDYVICFDRHQPVIRTNVDEFAKDSSPEPVNTSGRLTQAYINKENSTMPENTNESQDFKIMVTGHRTIGDPEAVTKKFKEILGIAIERHGKDNLVVIAGGAKGADFLFAKAAKAMEVRLHLYIPHIAYWSTYKPVSKAVWDAMLDYAEETYYSVPETVKWHYSANFKRNIDMIEAADSHVVCSRINPNLLAQETRGGTRHAVVAMKDKGVEKVYWVDSTNGKGYWVELS